MPAGYTRFMATVGFDQASGAAAYRRHRAIAGLHQKPVAACARRDSLQVPVALAELGLPAGSTVQDLWSGRAPGPLSGSFAPYIRRHGAGFYRISRPKAGK